MFLNPNWIKVMLLRPRTHWGSVSINTVYIINNQNNKWGIVVSHFTSRIIKDRIICSAVIRRLFHFSLTSSVWRKSALTDGPFGPVNPGSPGFPVSPFPPGRPWFTETQRIYSDMTSVWFCPYISIQHIGLRRIERDYCRARIIFYTEHNPTRIRLNSGENHKQVFYNTEIMK